jgi:hypothetical protein
VWVQPVSGNDAIDDRGYPMDIRTYDKFRKATEKKGLMHIYLSTQYLDPMLSIHMVLDPMLSMPHDIST